jgi:ABC-type Fe3+-hydroxamate transport system substrate-binding protein
MHTITDQIGEPVLVKYPVKRIVSLVPSLTETLVALGLQDNLVGVTKFCVHPKAIKKNTTLIGGTKNINIALIKHLAPDIVIASKEENIQEQIAELKVFTQVYVSDIKNLDTLTLCMQHFDVLFEMKCSTADWYVQILQQCTTHIPHKATPCLYLIWRQPYMTIGGDTFINYMLQQAGFINMYANHTRYPVITIEDLKKSSATCILLSSEPFPFKEKHIKELAAICPDKNIILVNGEIFSWYGHRMIHAIPYFVTLQKMLHI